MQQPYSKAIDCHDSLGRQGETVVAVDPAGRRVTVRVPMPAGQYDWHQLTALISALQTARQQLNGRR